MKSVLFRRYKLNSIMFVLVCFCVLSLALPVFGREYFVSNHGNDANNGASRANAFLTIQKGVNALKSGDTLTIGSGEYFGAVSRSGFGDLNKETVIRAEIPGTVTLRGDRNFDVEFVPVSGLRFVYVADCPDAVISVQEYDTLTNLKQAADPFALQFGAGRFFYDATAKKLYISSSDFQSPELHRYTVGVLKGHGFHFFKCKRIVLDGLAASGFRTPVQAERALLPVSGFMLHESAQCVVRNCTAYFCASGITINDGVGGSTHDPGDGRQNVIEDCVAYANGLDGIVAYNPESETIRNCRAFLNEIYGARFYGGRATDEECLMQNVIAWGNGSADVWMKGTGLSEEFSKYKTRGVGAGCIAFGKFNVNTMRNCVIGGNSYSKDGSTAIALPGSQFQEFVDKNFADALNNDFRLQGNSQYVRKSPGQGYVGAYPYKANVYYVKSDGNDAADGLSIASAWKTPRAAVRKLKAGDTLYIAPGRYSGDLNVSTSNVSIRGRGLGAVVMSGGLGLTDCSNISVNRIQFSGTVRVAGGKAVELANCVFAGPSVQAENIQGLSLEHDIFLNAPDMQRCANVVLSGNMYASAPALTTDSLDAISYSSYNSYPNAEQCWTVGGRVVSMKALQPKYDAYVTVAVPEIKNQNGVAVVLNGSKFSGRGPLSTGVGPYREWNQKTVDVVGPFVESKGNTSADIEWWSTLPVTTELRWGDTPECVNRQQFSQSAFYSYSLVGLQPGKKYYVQVVPVSTTSGADSAHRVVLPQTQSQPVSFAVGGGEAKAPATYYVALDGNDDADGLSRQTAWKSIQAAADRVCPGDTVLIAGGKYPGTFYFRATGEPGKPITIKAIPGETVRIDGMNETLTAGFVLYGKHYYHLDSMYFVGYCGIEDSSSGTEAAAVFPCDCNNLEITRCSISQGWGRCLKPRRCSNLTLRNSIFMDSMGSVMMYNVPDVVIENCLFISPLICHLHIYSGPDDAATVRNCIFGEATRGKVHATLLQVPQGSMSNCCFFARWPESDRLAFSANGGMTVPDYQAVYGDNGCIVANPYMLGLQGFARGWNRKSNAQESDDPYEPITFDRLMPTNPEVIVRDMGLQAEAFSDFAFAKTWKYDKAWATKMKADMDAAEALRKKNQANQAMTIYVKLANTSPMNDMLKTDLLDCAAQCGTEAKSYDRAFQIAKSISLEPYSVRRQMAILFGLKRYSQLIQQFKGLKSIEGWLCMDTEQVMADAFYYRGMSYAKTGDLKSAEQDLRAMVDKGSRSRYQPGPTILDLAWLHLGDFYRDYVKNDTKALESYSHVIDRNTIIRADMLNAKPLSSGNSEVLVAATNASCGILQKQGKAGEVKKLQDALAKAQADAKKALQRNR